MLRAPIYGHFSESIQGATSIRAYGANPVFIHAAFQHHDRFMVVRYGFFLANRWITSRSEMFAVAIILLTSQLAVFSRELGFATSAGLIGLSLTYAINVRTTTLLAPGNKLRV